MNVRAAAAEVIAEVMNGKSLGDCLPVKVATFSQPRDQALLQAICYGVCRHYFYLEALLTQLLEKPLKEKDNDLHALMLAGIYQLGDMRIPEYAAVGETVAVTTYLKKVWAKGLVNAVLRNYQRRAEKLSVAVLKNPATKYSHPDWLVDMLQSSWPDEWETILAANNEHPPFMLRVNQRCVAREEYLQKLAAKKLAATAIDGTPNGILLAEAVDVLQLPEFKQGYVSVQDGSAQQAAFLLAAKPGMRVLDACAAPGGKTAHIAELTDGLAELIALDNDGYRLKRVRENLQRLNLTATCVQGDAGEPDAWWDGKPFDRILLDAPCSATGVIRRHPDIKLLRRAADIANLAAVQKKILNALWPLLKTEGLLLYATCSVLPAENSAVVRDFLTAHPEAVEEKIHLPWGAAQDAGWQILPGPHGMDGFYYALLRKCPLG
jgi:16S rRNA (cytosine967-C5)-methyltransferase